MLGSVLSVDAEAAAARLGTGSGGEAGPGAWPCQCVAELGVSGAGETGGERVGGDFAVVFERDTGGESKFELIVGGGTGKLE